MKVRAASGNGTSLAGKVLLGMEILVVYSVTRWRMSRHEIRQVVMATRRPRRAWPRHDDLAATEMWEMAAHLGRAVDKTLRLLPTDSRCLVQSLVVSRLLAVRGIPSTLVIGAHPRPSFAAHAWVEYNGRPVLPVRGFGASRLLEL